MRGRGGVRWGEVDPSLGRLLAEFQQQAITLSLLLSLGLSHTPSHKEDARKSISTVRVSRKSIPNITTCFNEKKIHRCWQHDIKADPSLCQQYTHTHTNTHTHTHNAELQAPATIRNKKQKAERCLCLFVFSFEPELHKKQQTNKQTQTKQLCCYSECFCVLSQAVTILFNKNTCFQVFNKKVCIMYAK